VVHLLVLRFKTGDVFAPYSSLRSDPLGTRALYESLARLQPLTVRRNYETLPKFESGRDTTILYLGVRAGSWEYVREDWHKPFEQIVSQGGRLVVSFLPVVNPPDETDRSQAPCPDSEEDQTGQNNTPDDIEKKNADPQHAETQDTDPDTSSRPPKSGDLPSCQPSEKRSKYSSLRERWDLGLGYHSRRPIDTNNKTLNLGEAENDLGLPPVSWHTLLFFKDPGPGWKTIYALYGRPVIIERAMGRGSIVFAADSFFFSNEALFLEPNSELLAWLIGSNSQIVFDEHHLGITKTKGVVALIRTYRLHWFFAGIAFLAVLVIWKNATHFVPPFKPAADGNQAHLASERDHTQGLISLLRRYIAVKDILTVCVAEWKKAVNRRDKFATEKMSKIDSLPELQQSPTIKEIDPVSGYRKICSILSEGKKL
jgi:hypothetical protein